MDRLKKENKIEAQFIKLGFVFIPVSYVSAIESERSKPPSPKRLELYVRRSHRTLQNGERARFAISNDFSCSLTSFFQEFSVIFRVLMWTFQNSVTHSVAELWILTTVTQLASLMIPTEICSTDCGRWLSYTTRNSWLYTGLV